MLLPVHDVCVEWAVVDVTVLSAPCSPSNLSAVTLVGSQNSESEDNNQGTQQQPDTAETSQDLQTTSVTVNITTKTDTIETSVEEKRVERTTSEDGNGLLITTYVCWFMCVLLK